MKKFLIVIAGAIIIALFFFFADMLSHLDAEIRDARYDHRCQVEYGSTWHFNYDNDKCVDKNGKLRSF